MPIKGLVKHCNKAAAAIDSAISSRARVQAQADKKRGSADDGKGPEKRQKVEIKPVFQPTDGQIDVAVLSSLDELAARLAITGDRHSLMQDMREPFVLRCDSASTLPPELTAAIATFEGAWRKSPLRVNPGRALQRLRGPAEDAAWQTFARIQPVQNLLTPVTAQSGADLYASASPCLFAVASKTDAAFFEKDGLPSLRLAVSGGHRQVSLVRGIEAMKILGMDSNMPGAAMKLAMGMLNVSKERWLEVCRRSSVWRARVEPGDVLYVPAGMLTCELIAGNAEAGAGKARESKDASISDSSGHGIVQEFVDDVRTALVRQTMFKHLMILLCDRVKGFVDVVQHW